MTEFGLIGREEGLGCLNSPSSLTVHVSQSDSNDTRRRNNWLFRGPYFVLGTVLSTSRTFTHLILVTSL